MQERLGETTTCEVAVVILVAEGHVRSGGGSERITKWLYGPQ